MTAALEFLKAWHPDRAWSIGAIDPNTNDHAWLTTDDAVAVEKFIIDHQALGRNVYTQLNTCRPDLGTMRAHRSSVVVAECAHAEIDPPTDTSTPEALKVWQLQTLDRWTDPAFWASIELPVPTLVVFSGSGYQAAWKFEEPVVLVREDFTQDSAAVELVESRNRKLVEELGADPAATDVSRLLRLPGTVNFPGESKIAKGRTGPVPAELVYLGDNRITPIQLRAATPRAPSPTTRAVPEFTGAPSPENWRTAVDIMVAAFPTQGRHNAFLALAGGLANDGWPAEVIEAFTVEVAERMPGSDEKAIRDRGPHARATVEKVQAGAVVKGWGTLATEHVGADAVRAVTTALGLNQGPARDPQFAKFVSDAVAVRAAARALAAPTQLDCTAALRAARTRLARTARPEQQAEAAVLARVLQNQPLTDSPGEDKVRALGRAAELVIRHLPESVTQQQVEAVLMSSAGSLSDELPAIVAAMFELRDERAAAPGAMEFEVTLSGTNPGKPVPMSQRNFDIATARLAWRFRYDEFANKKLVTPGENSVEQYFQDHHGDRLRFSIDADFDFLMPHNEFLRLVSDRARQRTFHPVRDYLDGLEDWDGVERVETWLIRYAGAPDTPYVRAVSRLVLCAAVRRVRRPGCKFDEMLILEGYQGGGKSSLLQALCPNEDWFTDDFELGRESKELIESTEGKWIVEAAETVGQSVADTKKLKSQLSRRRDQARKAYGHEPHLAPRQFIIIGTTNEDQYLRDLTGDRRYWPVRCGTLMVELLLAERDQLWAEAAMLDLAHPEDSYIRLDRSLWEAATVEQNLRKVDDPTVVLLDPFLGDVTGAINVRDVWKLMGKHEEKPPSRGEAMGISDALKAMGWYKSARTSIGGVRGPWYERGTEPEKDCVLRVDGNPASGWKVKPASVAGAPRSVAGTPRAATAVEVPSN